MDFALILSLLVALVAAVGPIISSSVQARNSRKIREAELFFHSKQSAYTALLVAIVPEGFKTEEQYTNALRSVITAIQPALLVSRNETATIIRQFYFVYCDYASEWQLKNRAPEKIEHFRSKFWELQDCLRDEMYQFELHYKKHSKRFQDMRSQSYHESNKQNDDKYQI